MISTSIRRMTVRVIGLLTTTTILVFANRSDGQDKMAFYVDPVSGADGNDGGAPTSAFKTLARAKQAVATINSVMAGDITVYLRGGCHRLDAPLVFGPEDSGRNGFCVVYKNYAHEAPVISGAADLSGRWTVYDAARNIYKRTGVTSAFRQLIVNGKMRIRARMPNRTDDSTFGPYYTMIGVDSVNKVAKIHASEIANGTDLSNVEMVMNPHWYHYRGRISSFTISSSQAWVTFQAPESNFLFSKGDSFWSTSAYYFENSLDFLDAEGEWFLASADGVLYYKPTPDENMDTATVEVPMLDKLVQLTGASAASKVNNIRFEGLGFAHSGWNGPSTNGSAMTQACRELVTNVRMGAITAQYADSIEFASCTFRFMGLNALSFVKGVSNSSIHDCVFRWICGNGIVIHDDGSANPSTGDVCDNIKILNNIIAYVGQQYSNGIGIVAYFVKRLLVADNEICFSPYMGTQTGGQASANQNVGMLDTILRNNYVHHVMQVHDDGGAFYTLSRQPGTHVVDNCAYLLKRNGSTGSYAVAGLYSDNNSEYITWERNATVNCTAATYEQTGNGAHNSHWLNNVTTADSGIVPYTGHKANYIWPVKKEAEDLSVTGGTTETNSAYSNNSGISVASGTGRLITTFTGSNAVCHINTAYLTGSTDAATFCLLVNGVQADVWTATLFTADTNSPSLQIRHRITRGLALAKGDVLTLEVAPGAEATPARVDYVEIYARQTMAALDAPTGLKVAVLSDDSVQLAWDTGDSGATFNILRAASATGPFVMIASGITGSTWTDSGLVKAKPYYYHITANNLSGTSTASGSVRVIPHPLFCRSSLYATADAYVDRGYPTSNTGAATQITVKHASSTTIQRKGYVRFDLGGQTPAPAANATLRFVASTWNEPSTWQVYGLKDGDAGESWGESTLTWYNAPANYTTTGNTLDTGRTTYLGSISPAAGPSVGAMLELRSAALDAFLAADANKTVTFILIRSNSSDSANTSIASRENTAYGVPTLSFDRVVTDSDGDGFEDAFELLHGSDPVSPSSVPLRITSHGFSDPQQAYGVTASGFSPAWTYVLKRSTNLVDGFPVTIGDPVYSTGDPVTVYDASPPDGRAVFYRFESAP